MINHWVKNWTSEDCKSHVSLADRHEEIHRAKDGDPLMLVKDTLMLIDDPLSNCWGEAGGEDFMYKMDLALFDHL